MHQQQQQSSDMQQPRAKYHHPKQPLKHLERIDSEKEFTSTLDKLIMSSEPLKQTNTFLTIKDKTDDGLIFFLNTKED